MLSAALRERIRISAQILPGPGYRSQASYAGLVVTAQRRLRGGLRFGGNVTVARAYDQGENYNTQPNDVRYLPTRTTARAGDVPRVTATANGSDDFTKALQAFVGLRRAERAPNRSRSSGPTVDLNGDGAFNDRVSGARAQLVRRPRDPFSRHAVDLDSPDEDLWQASTHARSVQHLQQGKLAIAEYVVRADRRQPEPRVRYAAWLLSATPGAAGCALRVLVRTHAKTSTTNLPKRNTDHRGRHVRWLPTFHTRMRRPGTRHPDSRTCSTRRCRKRKRRTVWRSSAACCSTGLRASLTDPSTRRCVIRGRQDRPGRDPRRAIDDSRRTPR